MDIVLKMNSSMRIGQEVLRAYLMGTKIKLNILEYLIKKAEKILLMHGKNSYLIIFQKMKVEM